MRGKRGRGRGKARYSRKKGGNEDFISKNREDNYEEEYQEDEEFGTGSEMRDCGRGKNRFIKKRGNNKIYPSKNRESDYEEDKELDNGPKRPVDPVERDGNLAVDLLSKKIQLRRLVTDFAVDKNDIDDYPHESDEKSRYLLVPPKHDDGRLRPVKGLKGVEGDGPSSKKRGQKGLEGEGLSSKKRGQKVLEDEVPSSKKQADSRHQKAEVHKDNAEVIEDEEVLRIIGELEKEIDTTFSDIADVSDEEFDGKTQKKNVTEGKLPVEDLETSGSSTKIKTDLVKAKKSIEIKFDEEKGSLNTQPHAGSSWSKKKIDAKLKEKSYKNKTQSETIVLQNAEVGGLVNVGPYSRILFVGDSRLQRLENVWPEFACIKPQFLVKPRLSLDDVKPFILSHTDLPHLENGTLLMCSVGIHDIIDLQDFKDCFAFKDHKPMEIMMLREISAEDLFKLVMMRLMRASRILEEALDSSSVVCFTAIIPSDPIVFFSHEARHHSPKDHAVLTESLRDHLFMVRDKIKIVCDRVNKHLSRLTPLPSLWEIMCSYHQDREAEGRIFYDGLNITRSASQVLSGKLNKFLQELFFGLEIIKDSIEFHQNQEIILIGDSRLKELEMIWSGATKPQIRHEPDLGFYNLPKYIESNLTGLRNTIVLVCLGMNDFIKFEDDEECADKNHKPCRKLVSLCDNFCEKSEKFTKECMENVKRCLDTFIRKNKALMLFSTVYPIQFTTYMNSQLSTHKDTTGHDINPQKNYYEISEQVKKAVNSFNSNLKRSFKAVNLPVWDMYNVVCRGNEDLTLDKNVLKDGLFPSDRTAEELLRSYYSFVNNQLHHDILEDCSNYKYPYRPLPKCQSGESFKKDEPKKQENKPPRKVSSYLKPEPRKAATEHAKVDKADHRLHIPNPPPTDIRSLQRQSSHNSGSHHYSKERSPPPDRLPRTYEDGRSRITRSPERIRSSRILGSPERYRPRISKSPERFHRPDRIQKSRHSRSPDKSYRSRYSRSPERFRTFERSHRSNRTRHSERSHRHLGYDKHRLQRRPEDDPDALSIFLNSMKIIREQCQKEKNSIMREALLNLCETHNRECEMYLDMPDAHPDYAKEYRLFLEKKRQFIVDLGGDPDNYNYLADWGTFWPTRMFDLFKESWVGKKNQCINMLSSKRKRSRSSSSSSSSTSLSSSSSGSSGSKKKRKRSRPTSPQPKKADVQKDDEKWTPVDSKKLVAEPQERKIKDLKIIEVLGIFSYMKDKLGVLGVPLSVIHEKAKTLEEKGTDPNELLNDEETVTLLTMLNDKLSSIVKEGGSTIQKAIMLESQSLLKEILSQAQKRKRKESPVITIDVAQLAHLTMGKSISDTIAVIKSFLLYEGYTDVSREKLENIYLAVKDEQLKMNRPVTQLPSLQPSVSPNSTRLVEKPHENSEALNRPGPSQLRNTFLPPKEELTEEFFIGQKSFIKPTEFESSLSRERMNHSSSQPSSSSRVPQPDPFFSQPPPNTTSFSSSSGFTPHMELDEEFFTGKKFSKPNVSDTKPTYVPRRHILPPPAPVISGTPWAKSTSNSVFMPPVSKSTTGSFSSAKDKPSIIPDLDFDMMRKCLASLKNMP